MSARDRDRGLGAVARVREVRERDSRLGLLRASEEHHAQERRAEELARSVQERAAAGAPRGQGLRDWAELRRALMALAAAAERARDDVASAARLKAAAHEHWQRDRARLGAVEHLLEVRTQAHREELVRDAARELDDIGGQSWLRRREGTP